LDLLLCQASRMDERHVQGVVVVLVPELPVGFHIPTLAPGANQIGRIVAAPFLVKLPNASAAGGSVLSNATNMKPSTISRRTACSGSPRFNSCISSSTRGVATSAPVKS